MSSDEEDLFSGDSPPREHLRSESQPSGSQPRASPLLDLPRTDMDRQASLLPSSSLLSPPRQGIRDDPLHPGPDEGEHPRPRRTPERENVSPIQAPEPVSPIIVRSQIQSRAAVNSQVHEISDSEDDNDNVMGENQFVEHQNIENNVPAVVQNQIDEVNQDLLDNPVVQEVADANSSALDFQGEHSTTESAQISDKNRDAIKVKKKSKGKKRKAAEALDEDTNEEGSNCTICFESWSNSGDHRISSLKCGHFFGYACIEKWLKGTGASCPNCNEKSTKKDIRVHYVSKLSAIDTGERDRALGDLEKVRGELRELQLRHTELQVRLKLQQEKIDKLEGENKRFRERGGELPAPSLVRGGAVGGGGVGGRLVYQKKHEVCRPNTDRDKCCRVLACSEYHGMIVISQPSANPLFPGFGVRRFNMLDQKLGSFVGLGREVVRDLAFHPTTPELLLSCGQDKVARITNITSCTEVVKFSCDSEVWACDWARGGAGSLLYLGTKRSQVLVYDTREPQGDPIVLAFPGTERRPIISLVSVPPCPAVGLHHSGFLVLTLGSLWYWEHNMGDNTFIPHKLQTPKGALFWSLEYEPNSRLVLVVCRPSPLSKHLVMELSSTTLPTGRVVTTNIIMESQGGSYSVRSFLRSSLMVLGDEAETVMLVFSRGTGMGDQKVIVQEVGTGRIQQELSVGKPVLDIKQATINQQNYLAILGETELMMYKWGD